LANNTIAEPLGDPGAGLLYLLKAMGAVGLLVVVLLGALWLLKRYGHKAGFRGFGREDLKVLGQLSLGPKRSLVMVRFLNKVLLLGVTDHQINLIKEEQWDDDNATDFKSVLDKSRDHLP
jgi:flagellar protein FliO/FliZ